ncbi:MAG: coagulation factor 5/8 type domain-containing protein [Acidobacteria bacterium]|nr:coagulation factor 5/8 type domain-containing protein [Acidobacteriota bacterium]
MSTVGTIGMKLVTGARFLVLSTLVIQCLACLSQTATGSKQKPLTEFGPNVLVFSPSLKMSDIQQQIDKVYAVQEHSEFGKDRFALVFLPGEYHVDIPIGFYTEVIGLGATPDAVRIVGNVHSDASLPNNNATCTFWRAVEGFSVTPTGGTMQWAVSQAAPFRRMHVKGDIVLHQKGGWASGGWMSDSVVDGNVGAGPQQQWISRNSEWGSWTGANWNMVFVGVPKPPDGEWPQPPYTKVAKTPVVREKPFLQVDAKGSWSVRVPELRRESQGITWHGGSTPGRDIPLSSFYIAQAGRDSAAKINEELAKGKNLLLEPGIYDLDEPIRVTRADTVVMGLGFATLRPVHGTAALTVADVDGVDVAGVLIDAGEKISPVLMEVGREGSRTSHARNPIGLHDVFFRDGGAAVGRAKVNLQIDANDTVIDHTWIWRADHGSGVGWTSNLSNNGLTVNGNNVTAYGLFVEHHQQFQVLWKGEHGRTYFYQSEIPYDPPDQPSYTSAHGVNGWASYKVADGVASHEAWGLGIYSVFRQRNVNLTRAIEVPVQPEVRFHHMITVALDDKGEISNVINDKGGPTHLAPHRVDPRVAEFPQ